MIIYLLKSAICLTVLLAVYHLLLEKKKMHTFNRFYLLLSLVAGLTLPALTIKVSAEVLNEAPILSNAIMVQQAPLQVQPEIIENAPVDIASPTYSPEIFLLFFYVLITGVLAVRFAVNLIKIKSQINKHPRLKLNEASLVLLAKNVDPYSFLSYVFLNETDYRNGRVEGQLLEHELTHVRQMHSLDILFIEMLKILFWFNPVFIFYKNAIQLNHEFLADEAVVNTYEVYDYQYLLLERSIITSPYPLTSNLNFSLTKKRLTMMTKTTSKLKIWTARLAVVPVLAVLLLLFSMKTVSEKVPVLKPAASDNPAKLADQPNKEAFFKGATIWIENKDGKYMPKKYDEMTAAEKTALPDAPKIRGKVATDEDVAAWKTKTNVYTICINDKWVENTELAKYNAADFGSYSIRKPGNVDLRVNKNYGRAPNLVDIYTMDVHAKRFVEPYNKPGKWLAVYQNKIWPGGIDGSAVIRKYFELQELKKTDPNAGDRWLLPPFKPEPIK